VGCNFRFWIFEEFMALNSENQDTPRPHWRYLALAAAIFVVAALLLAGLWQVPRVFPALAGNTATRTDAVLPTAA
jgi:hypothetical protein